MHAFRINFENPPLGFVWTIIKNGTIFQLSYLQLLGANV